MAADFTNRSSLSDWGNKNAMSSSSHALVPVENSFPLQRSPTQYVVTSAKFGTQAGPPYTSEYRPVPSYPYKSGQAFSQDVNNIPKKSKMASCKEHITITRVVGLIVGLTLAGIPLAVMGTLYGQLLAASDSSATNGVGVTTTAAAVAATAAVTATTSASLPAQCSSSNYGTLNDATRLNTYQSCCTSDCISSGWYRVTGASGTRLATAPVSTGFCYANYPIWYNGSLPTTLGGTTAGMGCANVGGSFCNPSYSPSLILATNCSSFYVFFLPYPPSCGSVRYCTSF